MARADDCDHSKAEKVKDGDVTKEVRDRHNPGKKSTKKVGENWHCPDCGTNWFKPT